MSGRLMGKYIELTSREGLSGHMLTPRCTIFFSITVHKGVWWSSGSEPLEAKSQGKAAQTPVPLRDARKGI